MRLSCLFYNLAVMIMMILFLLQLERWWEELAYLSSRLPLLPYSHMMGIGVSNELIWGTGELTDQIKVQCSRVIQFMPH